MRTRCRAWEKVRNLESSPNFHWKNWIYGSCISHEEYGKIIAWGQQSRILFGHLIIRCLHDVRIETQMSILVEKNHSSLNWDGGGELVINRQTEGIFRSQWTLLIYWMLM